MLVVNIRDDLTYSLNGLQQYDIQCKDIECCWLQVLKREAKDIILYVVYRPPSGKVDGFCNILTSTMEEIGNNFNQEIFILGDFNINYLDKEDPNTKFLLLMELDTGLSQPIKMSTRGLNTIDLIYIQIQLT